MSHTRSWKSPVVALLLVLLVAAACSSSGGSKASSDTSSDASSASSDGSATDGKGSAALCSAFADIQGFTQVSAEVATKSWPEIQALLASKKDEVAAAYDKIIAAAPDTVAADVRLVAKFTSRLIDAAATASSAQEWAQAVGADPDARAAGAAATRMGTFSQTECGIDPASASS